MYFSYHYYNKYSIMLYWLFRYSLLFKISRWFKKVCLFFSFVLYSQSVKLHRCSKNVSCINIGTDGCLGKESIALFFWLFTNEFRFVFIWRTIINCFFLSTHTQEKQTKKTSHHLSLLYFSTTIQLSNILKGYL